MSQPSLGGVSLPFPKVATTVEHRLEEVEELIRAVVRSKLGVTLDRSDYRERNLDAFDLLGEIRLRLLRRLHSEGEDVAGALLDFRAYAATVAFNGCSDYFRRLYPERTRLQRCLRRALEKSGDIDVRAAEDGDLICNLKSWLRAKPWSSKDVPIRGIPGTLPRSILPRRHYGAFGPREWSDLARGILKRLKGPVRLDDLVSIVGSVLGIKDLPNIDPSEAGPAPIPSGPSQYEFHLKRERLLILWREIGELLPWHRIAYLLNMTDGEIDVFPYYGVATMSRIAEVLSLDAGQYRVLYDRLGVDPTAPKGLPDPSPDALRLAGVWPYLPLQDHLIAEVLRVRRSQVIGYRAKALQRLKRRVAAAVGSGT